MKAISFSLHPNPFYVHYCAKQAPANGMKTFHLHSDYELHWLAEGDRIFQLQHESIRIQENTLLLIRPHVLHRFVQANPSAYRRYVINFSDDAVSDEAQPLLCNLTNTEATLFYFSEDHSSTITRLVSYLYEEFKKPDRHYTLQMKALLTQLLIEIARTPPYRTLVHSKQNEANQLITTIIAYIQKNYNKPITLTALANLAHISPNHLSTLFKEKTGITLTEHIHQVRLLASCSLLLTTSLPINIIVKKTGFISHAHFNRLFKRTFNLSPTQYRIKHERRINAMK